MSGWKKCDPVPPGLDVGRREDFRSWGDEDVVKLLVARLACRAKVVLLTADLGYELRELLKGDVEPFLATCGNGSSLSVLFKGPNTSIDDYCARLVEFFERGEFDDGYSETRL